MLRIVLLKEQAYPHKYDEIAHNNYDAEEETCLDIWLTSDMYSRICIGEERGGPGMPHSRSNKVHDLLKESKYMEVGST